MKILFILLWGCQLFFIETATAQGPCNIPCCDQEFPYVFCDQSGNQYVKCSSNPNNDGTPAKAFIPGCVVVDQMDPSIIWQPNEAVPDAPTPPDREKIFENEQQYAPWQDPYDQHPGDWGNDETLYNMCLAQWETGQHRLSCR